MPLDTSGLTPLDVSGLDEVEGLDATGLVELDVSGLEPADGQPGTIAEIGQNVAEFGKGIPRGAGTTIGGALKGFGALLETASPELRPYLDELANLDTSNAEAVADLRRRADQGLRGKDRFTFHSAMSDVLEGAETGESLRAQLAKPVTETAGYRAGKAIEEASDIFPAAPGYEQSIGRQLGEGVGSVVAGVGVGLLPGGQVAGPAMFTLAGAGEAVDRAIQNGATEEQIVEAARLGTLAGMTDSVPVETLLGRIPVPGAGFVKVPANMLGTALKAVGRIGWQATIEGIQEGGQQFLQNLIAREVYKPDQDLTEDVLPSGGVGAGVGAITETGRMAIANFGGRRRPKGEREKAAEQPPTLTQDDIESPIPNDLIAEGKKVLQEADATKRAEDILSAAGLPGVGSRVTIDYGDGRTQSGVIDDAFTGEAAEIGVTGEGVKIKLDDGTTFEEFFDTLAQSGVRILEEGRQNADPDAGPSYTAEQTPEIEPETEPEPVAEPAPLDTTDLQPAEPEAQEPPFVRDANGVLEQEAPGYRFVPSQTEGMVDLIGPDGNAVLTARPPTSATLAIARRQAKPPVETTNNEGDLPDNTSSVIAAAPAEPLDTTDLLPLDQREQPDLLGGPTMREADAVADEQAAGLVEEARAEMSDAEIRAALAEMEERGYQGGMDLPGDVWSAINRDEALIGRMRAVLDRGERDQAGRDQGQQESRQKLPETVNPGGIGSPFKTNGVNRPLYRETDGRGLDSLLFDAYLARQPSFARVFVTDNPDLAIGQGDNKGVLIQFSPNAVSVEEHYKPGTGVLAGREYTTNYLTADPIDQILVDKSVKLPKRAWTILNRNFDATDLPDGRTLYKRKNADVGESLARLRGVTEQFAQQEEPQQKKPKAKAEPEPQRKLKEKIAAKRAEKAKPADTRLRDWSTTVIPNPDEQGVDGDMDGGATKRAFLQDARTYAYVVAKDLANRGFEARPDKKGRPTKAVNVNEGGPAVSGDVSLAVYRPDGSGVYMQIGTALAGPKGGISIMARRAIRESDPYGTRSQNQWLPVDLSAAEMADRLERIAGATVEKTPQKEKGSAETVARLENAAQATETPISATVEQEATRGEQADTQDRGVEDRGAVPAARQVYETVEEIKQAVREGTLKTKPDRAGFCYRFAAEVAIRGDGDYVIATVGHRTKGRIFHAVVEAPDGSIYDPQFDAWFSRRAYDDAIGGMVAVRRMTGAEVEAFGERTGKYPDPKTLGFDRPATDYRPGATEPPARDTVKPEEDTDGVQDRVSRSDAPAGAEDVQPAPAERATGRARSGQERRGAPDAERDAQQRAETAERSPEEPRSPAPGRGDRDGDADRVPERRDAGRAAGPAESVKGENFRIEPGALAEGRGWVQKARDNIRAIELMRQIEAEGRPATAEEQAQLALYVGWGGIRGAFPDASGKFGKGFEEIGHRLRDLLTDTEYATARRSIQYAHYTSETIVRAMWDAARRLGFRGGKVFEPGMGVGNFAGMMPADLAEATMYNGLELDHTTARIARLLYPKWGVRQDDFTKAPLPKDTYDLVIGNPPFADIPIKSDPEYAKHSFLLHDYFFAKSLDAVRPGGLLMFVTSAGTMNKIDQSAREYMADRADLVGAVRLPGDAFEKNAGTSVTTDIIILRKRLPGEKASDRSWVETAEVTLPNKEGKPTKGRVNSYFVSNPDMVLGEEGFFDKLYAGRYGVRSDGRDLGDALAKAMASLPENVMSERQTPEERAEVDFGTAERKEGSFYIGQDGKLYQMRDGVGRPVELRGKGVEGGVTLAAMERIKGLIPIRDALRAVYDADLKGDAENAAKARERLNGAYDRFVQRFGPINKAEISYRRPNVIQQEAARSEAREEARFAGLPFDEGSFDPTDLIERGASLAEIARQRKAAKEEAEKAGREWREGTFDPDDMPDLVIDKRPNIDPFMDDPESYRLRAIERYNDETGEAEKTAVFYENVITREKAPEIKSVGDALLYVLNKRGRVDLAEIAAAAGVSESEAVEQLGNAIFKVPGTETWQTREQYISGNVRQKLRQAKAAAERNPEFQRNVDALEAAQPAPLPPSEINANLGMPWLPPKVIEEFGKSLGLERIRVRYVPALAQWFVEGDKESAAATTTWGTSDRPAPYLISDALNRTDPKIYDTFYEDGKQKQVLNVEATQAAQDKVREIKERFSEWVWSDPARADELAALYNEQYNNLVVPEYDGSYLTTPGISSSWQWRPHQKRAIARIIQSGNTYLAHAVGAGKTSEMIGAAMEMRRLGLVKKPMFVVPNHMLGQFTKEFYEQYPTARIAVADERRFHTDRRKQFIADVANDDLDAIIITHSAFGLIPVSDAFQDSLIQEQIDQYRDILEDTDKRDPEQRITRRRLENAIEKLEQRLTGKKGRKDQVYTFEEMGVDFLFVDEAHLFRKLDFATKMSNVKGISPEGSKASFDLYTKTRYLETINPGRNLVLASGTPVTNTMAELYTVSRYLQAAELASRGLAHFDAWAGAFGDTVTQLEQDPAGGYKPVTRFAKFVNVPELSAMVRQVMDVVTSRQLEQYVTRPKLKGGKRQMNLAEKTEELDAYQQQLARRMQAIAQRKGPPKPGDDIILNVINDGRHAAIDMRLVDPTLPNDPGSKLNLLVDNVFRIWQETKRQPFHAPGPDGYSKKPVDYGPATQMIFANLGVGDSRPFSVHRYIVSELVRRGVPKDEIALIADYKTHVAKQRLFNDMNEGKKRVLIGSTAKMATGVNAQRRLYALHNLDPLWYPADDEQRNGRIIRQGNMNPEVEIHDYSTKGTYDSTMWGLMETKARFIQGFFEGDPSIRDMEDLGEASQYEQAKAITTADPRLIELTDLKQQLEKARRRKAAFEREQYAVRERIGNAKTAIARADERIPQIEADIARRQDTSGENFKAAAGKKTYTDRAEFGEALLGQIEVLQNEEKERKGVKLGEIGGFEIKADVRQMAWLDGKPWRAEVYIAREGGFDTDIRISGSARGLVQSLENALRGFEGDLEFQRRRKAEAEKTIADYTPQLDKQFTGQPEIDNLAKRVRELEAQLAAEAQALQQAQQPTEEGEKFSIRREFRGDLEKIAEQLQGRLRQLRIDDKIGLRLTEKIRSLSTGEAIPGVEGRYYRGLLQVALGARDRQWTLNHEAIHAMREIGLFRAAEWRTLEKAAKADTARMDEIRRRYGRVRTLTEEALVEEAIADMFADWAAGRMQVRGFIRDAFERIRAFLLAVYDALTGNGYRTLDDIFMAVETGRVGRRRDLRGRFAQEMLTGIDETGPMGLSQRFMDGWESFATSRSRTGDLIYSNEYRKRSADEMRMFERPARVVHAPASGTRPSGMPRPVWNDMVEKPWVIELPTAGNAYKQYPIRYRTEEEARSAVERMMPDEIERAAYRIASSPDLVDNLQKELVARGFTVTRDDAKTTESKYLYVDVAGTTVKLRFSGHSKTVFLGGTSRSHSAGQWDFSLGYSKPEGTQKIASIISLLEQARGQEKFMVAWHGSPHDFDQFTLDKIGTGEGNQAFGWGLYFAGNKKVADFYRRNLSRRDGSVEYKGKTVLGRNGKPFLINYDWQGDLLNFLEYAVDNNMTAAEAIEAIRKSKREGGFFKNFFGVQFDNRLLDLLENRGVTIGKAGRLYKVDLAPQEDEYLLWDKPLSEQSPKVQEAIRRLPVPPYAGEFLKSRIAAGTGSMSGKDFYNSLSVALARRSPEDLGPNLGDYRAASMALRGAGIPGIKYLDGSSRRKGEGNYNYVIFDDSLVSIEEKFSIQRPARPAGANDTVRFDNAKSEKRWQDARKGVAGQETLVTQTRAWLQRIAHGFTRHYIHLPNTREYSDVREQLRKLEAAPQASKEQVIRILRQITDGFTPADLDLFTRKVVLDDLAWEASQERDLPFGFTPEDVTREKAKIDAIIERRPDLAAAVRQRKLIVRKVANDLVAAGVLRKEQVKNPAYYRHQVLDYARATVQFAKGPGNKLRSPHWARRMGSTLDINANLLEAEFDWLHKAFTDIETAKTINWIKNSKHNIRSFVIAAAREHNNGLVKKALERDQEENGFIDNHGGQTSPLNEEWKSFKQRIAMGLSRVRKAIENGELFVPEEFEAAAGRLTGEFYNDESIFPFLAWIMDNDEAGAEGAALAFKAINQRKAWVKDLLGDRYADPNDVAGLVKRFAPEGYVAWQPDEGKLLYTAKTLPEHVIDAMLDRIAKEGAGQLSAAELRGALESVRSILAVGGDKFQMVIPEELAKTLNSFRDTHAEGLFEATLEVPMRWWKRWVLINPRRVIKYNINNLSGDLDAVIAGNPRALKKMPQAIKELWQVMIKGQAPSARYREAVERGVFDSGLSVQEIPDINFLSEFEHLIDKPSAVKRPDRFALSSLMRVWRALQKYTQFRENWLRYAAYLDYVERLEAGESMESIGYGAANPEMVDAVKDKKDKAALLARELVGDYGAISHWGKHIRRKLIPFWSWMEINTKRYWRLTSNAYMQGVLKEQDFSGPAGLLGYRRAWQVAKGMARGLVGAGVTGGFMGAMIGVRTTAWLGLRMVLLYGLVQLWNNLVFGDDEDELDPEERVRLHLLLGRGDDGQIRMLRFQGAFSDALSWFGFEDVVEAAAEIEKGRGDFGDIVKAIANAPVNKVASGLTPVLKLPIETATGHSFWPDVFRPMPIRDGWRHVAKSFAVEHEYDLATGRPSRGYVRSLEEAVVNKKDAGENAYNRIRSLTFDWLRKTKGQDGASSFSTPRSEALYEWRLAKRYGDEEAARAARQKLRDLGVTASDLEASIKRAHPLGAIAIKDRAAFLRTLSDHERDLLDQANIWYRQTFTN